MKKWRYEAVAAAATKATDSLTTLFITIIGMMLSCTVMQARLRLQTAMWNTKTHEETIIPLGMGFNVIHSRSAVIVVMQEINSRSQPRKGGKGTAL